MIWIILIYKNEFVKRSFAFKQELSIVIVNVGGK
jgi:ABC-type enterochelin transport system permease subunit